MREIERREGERAKANRGRPGDLRVYPQLAGADLDVGKTNDFGNPCRWRIARLGEGLVQGQGAKVAVVGVCRPPDLAGFGIGKLVGRVEQRGCRREAKVQGC